VEQLAQLQADATTIVSDAIDRRPPDVDEERWRAALRGLRKFIADGYGAEAERVGWPSDELYRVPELWSQVHLTGAALAVGDREIVDVTSSEIRIKTASGATLAFYRKPVVDYRVAYEALSSAQSVSSAPTIPTPASKTPRPRCWPPSSGAQQRRRRRDDRLDGEGMSPAED
jgi:hypothetical protein